MGMAVFAILVASTLVAVEVSGQNRDGVVFTDQSCKTIGGPGQGKPCVFPFRFGGSLRSSCITDLDPEGKFWCSTRVDAGGNHVTGTGEWGHCSAGCAKERPTSSVTASSSSSSSSSSSVSSSSSGQTSSAFTVEGTGCKTRTGVSGTCRIPSLCVGTSLDFIERNPCSLASGEEGVCCVDISIDNIISIVDAPPVVVDIPNNLDTQGIFLRTDFGVQTTNSRRFASQAPAEDVTVDTNFVDDKGPSEVHLRFNTPRNDIVRFDQKSQVLLEATRRIKAQNNLTDLEAGIGLRNDFNSDTNAAIRERCPWVPAPRCPIITEKYRTFDGSCNNPRDSNFGRTGTPFQRILLPEYARGTLDLPRRSSVDNTQLPSARTISNALSAGSDRADPGNTVLVMQMGQFIDHDITHTPNHGIQCCGKNGAFPASFDEEKCSPIRLFSNDPFWKGKKTCMNFARSLSSPSLKCGLQTREQLNQITHWIDGSNIYGSTDEDAAYLRAPGGKLKETSQRGRQGSLPSCAREPSGKVTGCDVCGSGKKDCFFAGDFRVNEQLNLIVLHTLFMREHNRLATELKRMNPRWSDETVYQEARRINVAEYQHIVFKEWLPIIIGNNFMKSYGLFPLSSGFSSDYSDSFDPRINNEFAAAAFRFGHSMIPSTFSSVSKGRSSETSLNMRELFFKPASLRNPAFLDGLVRGMTEQGRQLWDSSFVPDVRNHLFESSPGRGGLDLVAVNTQRGRDHGLPGYNKYREICTGNKAKDWADLRKSIEPRHIEQMRRVYKSVDDIDLYLGGFLEAAHEDSILGPVFKCIIGDQFARLKKGDKFFYDLGVDQRRAFTLAQLEEIRKTSMARIICDNTDDIDRIQPLAFKMPTSRSNAVRLCTESSIPKMDMSQFDGRGNTGR